MKINSDIRQSIITSADPFTKKLLILTILSQMTLENIGGKDDNVDYHNSLFRLYWRFLNPLPHNDTFWRLWETSLLKTQWEKEKLLVTSNFSFSHSVFYPFRQLSSIFVKFEIVVCKLFQFGKICRLVMG